MKVDEDVKWLVDTGTELILFLRKTVGTSDMLLKLIASDEVVAAGLADRLMAFEKALGRFGKPA